MEINSVKMDHYPTLNPHKKFLRTHVLLRILASAATLTAALTLLLNKQISDIGGYQLKASYQLSPTLKFFLVANAIAGGYSLISLFFVSHMVKGYLFNLLDLVSMGLVIASDSAMSALAYMAKEGNENIGWSQVCPYFEKFCNRLGISLACSFLGLLFLLLMCAISSVYKTRQIRYS